MKRTFILVVMAFLLIGSFLVAEEATIIDFTLLDADIIADENGNQTQNRRTVMNYGIAAGATFTPEQKSLMKTSLSLPNWEVNLNSSAKTVTSVATSTVVPAPVREGAKVPFAGKNVMGVRILFPSAMVNSNAFIKPAFEIPAYEPLASADDNGDYSRRLTRKKQAEKPVSKKDTVLLRT